MTTTLIGYARCSTDKQDLAAQRAALGQLGVAADRIYTDHGLTGTNRLRPGLDQALAAVRTGDTLVVPKLDRLARSVPDARFIADALIARGVRLALGSSVYDPVDPMGKMFFNILATFAEFEADLIRLRTREGMAIARARGKLRGKKPKLSDRQQKELRRMHDTGDYSISDIAELFSISRPTVYRPLGRQAADHIGQHADPLVELDQGDHERRSSGEGDTVDPVLDGEGVDGAGARRGPPVDLAAKAARAERPGVEERLIAVRAPGQDEPTLSAGVPERLGSRPYRGLQAPTHGLGAAHRTAPVPRTKVDMHDKTTPEPWATATSAPVTCRSPHSPRSWRTASTTRNMPYIPGWV